MRATVNVSHISAPVTDPSTISNARRDPSRPHFCEQAAFIPLLPIAREPFCDATFDAHGRCRHGCSIDHVVPLDVGAKARSHSSRIEMETRCG
jgi:hypothetical protein